MHRRRRICRLFLFTLIVIVLTIRSCQSANSDVEIKEETKTSHYYDDSPTSGILNIKLKILQINFKGQKSQLMFNFKIPSEEKTILSVVCTVCDV